ncbi:hypothetical protein [Streptomyces sp. NBC_00893]|uniref:hypothetical protein n=1 Tax=Streptomyces sp. NBC_00893 TaxID=2975862 RepID=UPI0022587851|nr:hypothetical protein [Streptomyces sp. NBC_00893]MCX4846166.1 hypothetical protein [Streptomyces sp. NBC_00893]
MRASATPVLEQPPGVCSFRIGTSWLQERAIVHCPSCARPSGIDRWSWEDDYYACGHLGFTFWGWAELTSDFTREIGRRPGGHRTVLLAGKL